MKRRITNTCLLILSVAFINTASLHAYPLADPNEGEGRPGWWWRTFYDDIFIVKGIITTENPRVPNSHVKYTREKLDSIYFGKSYVDKDVVSGGKYVIGTLKITDVLLISENITATDGNAERLANGERFNIRAFIPATRVSAGTIRKLEDMDKPIQYWALYSRSKGEQWYMIAPNRDAGLKGYYISHLVDRESLKEIEEIIEHRRNNGTL